MQVKRERERDRQRVRWLRHLNLQSAGHRGAGGRRASGEATRTRQTESKAAGEQRKEWRVEQGKLARRADNAIQPVSDSRSSRRPPHRFPWPREGHRSPPHPRPAGHHRLGDGDAGDLSGPAGVRAATDGAGEWVPPWRGAVRTAVAVAAGRQVPATVTAGESTRPREQEAIVRYCQPRRTPSGGAVPHAGLVNSGSDVS